MSFGITTYRYDSKLAITSSFPAYRFAFRTTASTFTCGGAHPPMVFSRVLSTSSGYPAGLMVPDITGSAGAWTVTVRVVSVEMRADAYATHTASIESLVFTTEPVPMAGYGVYVGDGATGGVILGGDAVTRSLVVRAIASVDPNPSGITLSGYAKSVAIPSPMGTWFTLCGSGLSSLVSTGSGLFDVEGTGYMWPTGAYMYGVAQHSTLIGTTLTSIGSYTSQRGSAVTGAWETLFVDSYFYE